MFTHVFFDLDGTLSRSEEGIFSGIEYATKRYGLPVPDRKELKVFIGPPLSTMFSQFFNLPLEEGELLTQYYRVYYNEMGGVLQCEAYAGVKEMLQTLQSAGKHLYLITAKPLNSTKRVLEHLGIACYLEGVFAATETNITADKTYLVGNALQTVFADSPVPKSGCVMVGDRLYDVTGAANNGISSIGVTYGYGTEEELKEAGATFICHSPQEIVELVKNT